MKILAMLFVMAAAVSAAAALADPQPVVARHNYHGRALPSYVPPLAHKRHLSTIVDNFAQLYPKGLYNATVGSVFGGPASELGQTYLAVPFTPAADATMQEVDVAAGFIGGNSQRSFTISVYDDASGLPGKPLFSQNASLPLFGQCCAVVSVDDTKGLKLQAKTQYWVVLTTPNGSDVNGAWNAEVLDQVHPGVYANNHGSGWQSGSITPQFTFGVYGKK